MKPETDPAPAAVERPELESGLRRELRLICVSPVEPSWIRLTLRLDAAGCTEPRLRWVRTAADALAALREHHLDAILIWTGPFAFPLGSVPPQPPEVVTFVSALRGAGHDGPILVVGEPLDEATAAELIAAQADCVTTSRGLDSPLIPPLLLQSLQRWEIRQERDRLAAAEQRRAARDRDEAAQLLMQQRVILARLARIEREFTSGSAESHAERARAAEGSPTAVHPAEEGWRTMQRDAAAFYRQLLRTHVIMGNGQLDDELTRFSRLLCEVRFPANQVLELHLEAVEELVRGLGQRSARHVLSRAEMLLLDLMVRLADAYRGA